MGKRERLSNTEASKLLLQASQNWPVRMGEVDTTVAAGQAPYQEPEIATSVAPAKPSTWSGYTTHMSETARQRLAEMGQKRLSTKVGTPNITSPGNATR